MGYPADAKGVVIDSVEDNSQAADKGLQAGMVIDRVGEKAVANAQEFSTAIAAALKSGSVRLRVGMPDGGRRFVLLTPK